VRRAETLPLDEQPTTEAGDGSATHHRQAVRALAEALIAEVEANATGAATSAIAAAAKVLREKLPIGPGSERAPGDDSPWALGAGIGFALAALLRRPDR
jgi:hypothetical protein